MVYNNCFGCFLWLWANRNQRTLLLWNFQILSLWQKTLSNWQEKFLVGFLDCLPKMVFVLGLSDCQIFYLFFKDCSRQLFLIGSRPWIENKNNMSSSNLRKSVEFQRVRLIAPAQLFDIQKFIFRKGAKNSNSITNFPINHKPTNPFATNYIIMCNKACKIWKF